MATISSMDKTGKLATLALWEVTVLLSVLLKPDLVILSFMEELLMSMLCFMLETIRLSASDKMDLLSLFLSTIVATIILEATFHNKLRDHNVIPIIIFIKIIKYFL
jgi:hypothetical protein